MGIYMDLQHSHPFENQGGVGDLPAFSLRWGSGSCPMVRRIWPRFWYHSWRMPCWRRPGLLDVGSVAALSEETMGCFFLFGGMKWMDVYGHGVEDQFKISYVRTYSFYFCILDVIWMAGHICILPFEWSWCWLGANWFEHWGSVPYQ